MRDYGTKINVLLTVELMVSTLMFCGFAEGAENIKRKMKNQHTNKGNTNIYPVLKKHEVSCGFSFIFLFVLVLRRDKRAGPRASTND